MKLPRIMIAGTKSGSGKTTITCGLIRALKRRALNVHAFKCGPDYIDPMFHRSILGIPSKNLDMFFVPGMDICDIFAADNDSDISVIEGVMGLYDGVGGVSIEASSYHLAATLNTPVILVVDAHGMGRSVIAEIQGFLSMDDKHLIKAVILNRVSASFYSIIAPVIEKELGICALGFFPNTEDIRLESRHLGLVLPEEVEKLDIMLDKAADIVSADIDLDALIALAGEAANLDTKKYNWLVDADKPEKSDNRTINKKRIAIAKDEAFCFYYEDNLRMLKENGVELVPFSPIHDKKLPEGIDGLILGGGYPELYLEELSANESMRASVKDAIDNGIISIAECGGFMYLHEEIMDKNGECFDMVGAVRGCCEYKGRLVRFGYITVEDKNRDFLKEGEGKIRGHEFHYFDSTNNGHDCLSVKPVSGRSWESSHVSDRHFWGFAHLYYPSNPGFVKELIRRLNDGK